MSDLGLRIVEVEPAPCRHLHASNYDPAKMVPGQPIQVLGGGRMWCFDCKEFFTQQVPPQRYTLAQIETLAKEWRDANHVPNDIQLAVSHLLAWLARREREGRDGVLR